MDSWKSTFPQGSGEPIKDRVYIVVVTPQSAADVYAPVELIINGLRYSPQGH